MRDRRRLLESEREVVDVSLRRDRGPGEEIGDVCRLFPRQLERVQLRRRDVGGVPGRNVRCRCQLQHAPGGSEGVVDGQTGLRQCRHRVGGVVGRGCRESQVGTERLGGRRDLLQLLIGGSRHRLEHVQLLLQLRRRTDSCLEGEAPGDGCRADETQPEHRHRRDVRETDQGTTERPRLVLHHRHIGRGFPAGGTDVRDRRRRRSRRRDRRPRRGGSTTGNPDRDSSNNTSDRRVDAALQLSLEPRQVRLDQD